MEITIENPIWLLFLFSIPLMVVLHHYFFEHNKKKAMKFANFSALKRVTGTHLITKNTTQLVVRIIILALIILSAAQIKIWYEGKTSTVDYVIAIDSSASMIAEDVMPNRLDVAKQAAISFLDKLDAKTNVGIVSFAGATIIKRPLDDDMLMLKEAVSDIDIEMSGGTDIGSAMITSVNLMKAETGQRSRQIILMTDGSDTAGSFIEESVDTSLDYVIKNHVIVNTIGIGTGNSRPGYIDDLNLRAAYDSNTLKSIAERTGGSYFEVKSTSEIASAMNAIQEESEKAIISFDTSYLLLALSFLLLFFEWGLLNTKFRAIP